MKLGRVFIYVDSDPPSRQSTAHKKACHEQDLTDGEVRATLSKIKDIATSTTGHLTKFSTRRLLGPSAKQRDYSCLQLLRPRNKLNVLGD